MAGAVNVLLSKFTALRVLVVTCRMAHFVRVTDHMRVTDLTGAHSSSTPQGGVSTYTLGLGLGLGLRLGLGARSCSTPGRLSTYGLPRMVVGVVDVI